MSYNPRILPASIVTAKTVNVNYKVNYVCLNNVSIHLNPKKVRTKYTLGRLGVKSLFNVAFDGGSTAPKETDLIRLEVPKSTSVNFLGSTPTSKRNTDNNRSNVSDIASRGVNLAIGDSNSHHNYFRN